MHLSIIIYHHINICLVATTSLVIQAINYEQLGLLNGPILLVGKQKQHDFRRSRGAPLRWQSSELTCWQKACQNHSTLNCRHTGTARACGSCQFTPLCNTHSCPFLEIEGEREREPKSSVNPI